MEREASSGTHDVVGALRRVLDDPAHRDATAVRQTLLDRGWTPPPDRPPPSREPHADATFVDLLSRGWSAQETAVLLGVSLSTLADQLARLRSTYACTSTAEALRRARDAVGASGEH